MCEDSAKKEGNETAQSHWKPEQYDDMLANSVKVQDVIIGDIVDEIDEGNGGANIEDVFELDSTEMEEYVRDGIPWVVSIIAICADLEVRGCDICADVEV